MPRHPYANLSDLEIDAHAQRRDQRWGITFLGTIVVIVASITVAHFAPRGSGLETVASLLAAITIMGMLGVGMILVAEEDDLGRLEQNNDRLNDALDVLKRSPAARRLRDEILASGRSLRVFDLHAFQTVHDDALRQQKVQQVLTLA